MAAVLCGVFFASGASALIFETLWFHQAGLALGSSVWASSLVLAGFMAGLGLGNALAARYGERVGDPLRAYAIAEVAIAVSGVGLVFLFPRLGAVFAPALRSLLDTPWLLNTLRLIVAFVLLVVPSTAMGITLPLLTKTLARHDNTFGSVLGRLYGWNTLGAVAGVAICELLLIVTLGIRRTAIVAGALDVAAAGVAWWLSRRELSAKTGSHTAGSPRANMWLPPSGGRARAWRWLFAVCLSGAALLALEVVWFRILLLVVDAHAAAFALMLAVVLAGIAVGGLVAGRAVTLGVNVPETAGCAAFAASVLCVLSYVSLPWVMNPFLLKLASTPLAILQIAAPLMFPVSFVSGAFFTLAGAALRARVSSDAEAVGRLTLANTIGAAAGALAGGFLLLPMAGMERSIAILAALYGLLGIYIASIIGVARRRLYAAGAACVATLALFPFGIMRERLLASPVSRYLALRSDGADQRGQVARVVAVNEGLNETIQYVQMSFLGQAAFHQLLTNAVAMADTEYFSRRYMKLYVYWPLALHAKPSRALLICYGVGSTAKAMTDSSDLVSIDIVDISRDVLEASRIVYQDASEDPLRDPRVRVHVEDGRYFLQASEEEFDLITAEPPPPTAAGAVNLYTREYFQLVRSRLAQGGMTAYWLPLHALSDVSARGVLRAFCDVFDDCSLWHGSGAQLMMVGTKNATGPVSEERFTAQWRDRKVFVEMGRLGFERPEQLGALFIGDADYLKKLTEATQPLTDDYPRRINARSRSQADADTLMADLTDTRQSADRFSASPFIRRLWPQRYIAASLPFFDVQRIINGYTSGGAPHISLLHGLVTGTPLLTPALWLMGSDWDTQAIVAAAAPAELATPRAQFQLGIRLLVQRSYPAAAVSFARAEALPELRANAFAYRVYALCLANQIAEAKRLGEERPWDASGETWNWLKQTFGLG